MSFLPEGYEQPSSMSKFMKFKAGENVFRVLSECKVGWEYWVQEGDKRVVKRVKDKKEVPANYFGNADRRNNAKFFWAFVVYNLNEKMVQLLTITQSTIQKEIYHYTIDEDWGEPTEYNLSITKEGEEMETKYYIKAKPKKELSKEALEQIEATEYNIDNIFTSGNVFEQEGQAEGKTDSQEIDLDDIPF